MSYLKTACGSSSETVRGKEVPEAGANLILKVSTGDCPLLQYQVHIHHFDPLGLVIIMAEYVQLENDLQAQQ